MNLMRRRNQNYESLSEFDRLQREINRLFDFDATPDYTGLFDRTVSPAIDVVETGDDYLVLCDLPGVEQKDVEMSIESNILTIKGEKKLARENKNSKIFRSESWSGSFQRTLSLPNTVDAGRIEAELKDGVLRVRLPKREEVKPKQIAVKVQ